MAGESCANWKWFRCNGDELCVMGGDLSELGAMRVGYVQSEVTYANYYLSYVLIIM